MTYKLQDSSEETARISVTDTYGILPIANELLIALTYEGAESDHVADTLAQFEAQAIDLSHSLGGDLTNSINEQLKQRHDPTDAPLMDRIEEERLLIQTAENANIGNKTIFTSIIESMTYDYSQLEHA